MKKLPLFAISICFIFAGCNAQNGPGGFVSRYYQAEAEALAQPYVGIVTDKGKIDSLFPIQATGVSTAPAKAAAEAFLDGLSEADRAITTYPINDDEWRKWCNMHFYKRQGKGLIDMTEQQKALAFGLMEASLSAKGLSKSKRIMALEGHLAWLLDNHEEFGHERYYFTIMGTPSETDPWGWQVDGHHLNINYFILGDQVVMTPTFMGSEPVKADEGPFAGNAVFEEEEKMGLDFIRSLDEAQLAKAIISKDKTKNYNETEALQDNKTIPYQGLQAAELNEEQRTLLLALINEYVSDMDDGHAHVKMSEIQTHLEETWVSWVGGTEDESVFYYRIHSPVILIEFDHQGPVALRGRGRGPIRDHIHTVVRTPNGNDYGKDLLKQHLEKHH